MNIILLLGFLLLLGLLATRISKKISLPNVTAFLIIGLIFAFACIGIDYTGYICPDGYTLSEELTRLNKFVSSVALGFIALSIGEEFKISKIKEYGMKVILITILQALLAVVLVDIGLIIACIYLDLNVSIAICLGAIATATAPAATIMVIHQYEAKGPLVDLLLPVVAFDDALGLIIFAMSLSISRLFVSSESISLISLVVIPLLEIFGSILLGLILGLLMYILIKWFKSRNNHMVIIISFTLIGVGTCSALNLIAIQGQQLDFSSLLCCMMIGSVYVNLPKDNDLPTVTRDVELMSHWTPFLFTLFFVLSGANLVTSAYEIFKTGNIDLLWPIIIIFILYIILRSSGKYIGAFFGCKITKRPKEVTNNLGICLLPQAGVAIGMAYQISGMSEFSTNNIGDIIVTVVLCATLIYELIGPLLTKQALTKAGEIGVNESSSLQH